MGERESGGAGAPGPLRLAAFLPYRLSVLAALASEGLARLYARRFGITIPEWRVLATLGEAGAATAAAVGAHAVMHKTKVSRAVAALERRGLVARGAAPGDRRSAPLTLTAEGARVYAAIAPLALAYEARLLEGLDAGERAALDRLAARLTARSRALAAFDGAGAGGDAAESAPELAGPAGGR